MADKNLQAVIESGMCIACGACKAVEPDLEIALDPKLGFYQPRTPGSDAAHSVCPAVAVNFQELQEKLFDESDPGVHGVVEGVFLAQSLHRERNLRASSGGIIKELMHHFLSLPEVDGIIGLKHTSGLRFEPGIIDSPSEIDSLPGSIYHNVSLEKALELLLSREGRFVVTGIPCQLEGIYNVAFKHRSELLERIHSTIGLICGWNYSHHSLRALCSFKGLDYDRIESISYRGGGPVGKLKIQIDGETRAVNRRVDFDYQVAFDRSFNLPRCHLCVNHVNFLADIVVGDAWLPSTVATKTGVSVVVCRRRSGVDTLRALEAQNRIRLSEASEEEITESQSRAFTFGDKAYAYMEYLKDSGRHAPEMEAPNRKAAQLAPRGEIEKLDLQLQLKRQLQQEGRYRALWWRKATIELRFFLWRYIRWFGVRVLKVKKLFGGATPEPKLKEFN